MIKLSFGRGMPIVVIFLLLLWLLLENTYSQTDRTITCGFPPLSEVINFERKGGIAVIEAKVIEIRKNILNYHPICLLKIEATWWKKLDYICKVRIKSFLWRGESYVLCEDLLIPGNQVEIVFDRTIYCGTSQLKTVKIKNEGIDLRENNQYILYLSGTVCTMRICFSIYSPLLEENDCSIFCVSMILIDKDEAQIRVVFYDGTEKIQRVKKELLISAILEKKRVAPLSIE